MSYFGRRFDPYYTTEDPVSQRDNAKVSPVTLHDLARYRTLPVYGQGPTTGPISPISSTVR